MSRFVDDDPSEHCCFEHWLTGGDWHNNDCPDADKKIVDVEDVRIDHDR